MRKNIWKNVGNVGKVTPGNPVVQVPFELKPDRMNKHSFPAFSMSLEEEVLQALMTGSLANTFYSNAKESTDMFLDAFNRVDTAKLARSIVYAREKGFTRLMPVVATVVLSRRDTGLYRKIAHRVMRNPRDWKKFIDICRSKEIRQGLGRTIKREINADIKSLTPYHATKYASDVYDMISIARPNAQLNPLVIDYIKGLKPEYKDLLKDKYSEYLEAAKEIQDPGLDDQKKAKLIRFHRLPYELVSSQNITPRMWESLLYSAPYQNLIHNLNNFGRNKVYENPENLRYAVSSLMNPDKIKNSRIFPFRFYLAQDMVGYRMVQTSKNVFEKRAEPYNGMNEIKNALAKALEISIDNIPEVSDVICVAPDVSGSMQSAVIENMDKSKLQCINLVGLFTGIIVQRCKHSRIPYYVLPFDTTIDENMAARIRTRETIFDVAKEFVPRGGTSLSAPVEYLIHRNIKVDRIVAFTDGEEWVGSSFIDAFYLYKSTISPDCKAYLVKLIPSKTQPAPPDIKDVYFLYGWNENVLKYVTGDISEQMEEVNRVEL